MQNFENFLLPMVSGKYLWSVEIFLIVFAALLFGYIVNKVVDRLEIHAARTKNVWDDAFIEAFRKPVVWLIWILGVNLAGSIAMRMVDSPYFDLIEMLNRVAVIFLIGLFFVNFITRAERNLVHPEYLDQPVDATTVRAIGKLLRISVIITAALITLQVFGYSISGVLAFGGIGGIAIGFAAKDLLANFFGGLMIYLDRPFSVGDWVRSPDKEIEGTVEDIGWRLTRIRTFDKRPLYIPNSVFANISVENPSRMLNRRIYETMGIRYDDIAAMENVVNDVRTMLQNHSDIDTNQTLMVNFNAFSESSVDFFIYTFTKTTDWATFHHIKQDVLLKVADIVADNSAEMAFPTSTVLMPDPIVISQQGEVGAASKGR